MNLIELFNKLDLDIIEKYIQEKQEENLHLDFKEINRNDLSHTDDKKNFSKALSGFANSDGGLIIWGIKAKKNSENIDCAQEKVPIINVQLLVSRLNELTGRSVNPIIDNVLHKAIFESGNAGYAISYIPASDSGPHMGKLGEDRYYKRSGDSFYRMEHYDILRAARNYMVWICKNLNLPDPQIEMAPEPDLIEMKADDYVSHLIEKWRLPLSEIPEEKFHTPCYTSNWGVEYCIDAMLEHAVMHPIRHEFQLNNLIEKQKNK